MTVIKRAEARMQEEIRQNELGADNDNDLAYWAAYLDGARAQMKECERWPHGEMRDLIIDLTIEKEQLLARVRELEAEA